MSALTADRATRSKLGRNFEMPAAAGVVIHAGALVAIGTDGYVHPGATATTLRGLGCASESVDNSSGAAGAVRVPFARGVFAYGNSAAADAITLADVGTNCYIVDDQSVSKTSGSNTRSVAGVVRDVDAAGVWVEF